MPRIAHASPQSCRGFLNDCLHDSGQPLRYTPSINAWVHNVSVPFTLAHSAAALPLRRLRLVLSALVIGTLAPDFEYFLHFSPSGRFGHTLLGSLVLTLPLALLVLWIFHAIVKIPVIHLLPNAIQRRLHDHVYEFRFRGVSRSLLIVVSVLLGIATHLVWDAFTYLAVPSLVSSPPTAPVPDLGADSLLQGFATCQFNHWDWSSCSVVHALVPNYRAFPASSR